MEPSLDQAGANSLSLSKSWTSSVEFGEHGAEFGTNRPTRGQSWPNASEGRSILASVWFNIDQIWEHLGQIWDHLGQTAGGTRSTPTRPPDNPTARAIVRPTLVAGIRTRPFCTHAAARRRGRGRAWGSSSSVCARRALPPHGVVLGPACPWARARRRIASRSA